ncbi:MAG: hypothetical protein FJ056_07245 [Cyanobacteria bacterium M_surface_10_m2_179]|nr:hypothetical protein [Cyanobacteria bacterium M_surface_10_m2_179]MBM5818291.1 hypothetical protein [Cyanobacteria bacterium K_Offshore_surface_m2_239]
MPDTFALLLAAGIIGTSVALAGAIVFDDSRGRKRSIEHYRKLERERVLRVRRLTNQVGGGERGRRSWDHYLDDKNQRAA